MAVSGRIPGIGNDLCEDVDKRQREWLVSKEAQVLEPVQIGFGEQRHRRGREVLDSVASCRQGYRTLSGNIGPLHKGKQVASLSFLLLKDHLNADWEFDWRREE